MSQHSINGRQRTQFNEKLELSFREPLLVVETVYYITIGASFARCPRCRVTLEREYTPFCDRCGQALDWKNYDRAIIRLV